MIVILPRSGGGFQRLDLLQPHELFLCGFGEETAPVARTDKPVNVLDQLFFEDHMSAFA